MVDGPDALLEAFVHGCDTRGRYPRAEVCRLFWWQAAEMPAAAEIDGWVDELLARGLMRSADLYVDIYSSEPVAVLTLMKRGRYQRFAERPPIPPELREAVYARDGWACVACGRQDRLSLDHKHPYSRGGEDTYENLQTMCVPCNARKGNKTDEVIPSAERSTAVHDVPD